MIRESLKEWHFNTFYPKADQKEFFEAADKSEFVRNCVGFALVDQNEDQMEEAFAIFCLRPLDDNGRYLALAYLSESLGPRRLLFATRQARSFLDNAEYRRIEAYSAEDEIDGFHWCRYVLKMDYEGRLRSLLPDGRDVYLFSRVNDGR